MMTANDLKSKALAEGLETEKGKALWEAYLDLSKIENDELKLSESEKRERFDKIVKIAELVGTVLVVPVLGYVFKLHFAKSIVNFEMYNTFTTTPGKSIKDFFRW